MVPFQAEKMALLVCPVLQSLPDLVTAFSCLFLTEVLPKGAQGNLFPLPGVSTCSLEGWIGLENSAGKVWGDEMGRQ